METEIYIYIYIYTHTHTHIYIYEGVSKCFRPDQLFKVTETNNFATFQYIFPVFQHILILIHEPHHRWRYTSLAAFTIWRGFCMSSRKLLDPPSFVCVFIYIYIYIYIYIEPYLAQFFNSKKLHRKSKHTFCVQ